VIGTELRRIATAATFLTRLPGVARCALGDPVELGRSARWFPLVGIAIGALGAGVYWAASSIWPPALAALAAIAAMVLATGAFHEDGLADAADGLFGGWTAERRLEIMRDSRVGTFGAMALVLLVLGKWQAIAALDPGEALPVLIGAHAAARWSTLALARALPYVRDAGAMKPVASGIGPVELAVGSLVTLAALAALGLAAGVVLVAIGAVATLVIVAASAALYRARIGGITGDCLGATNQLVEVAWLLAAAAVLA
jgi:adenosylcobinamide-GDP ribazoletransferase